MLALLVSVKLTVRIAFESVCVNIERSRGILLVYTSLSTGITAQCAKLCESAANHLINQKITNLSCLHYPGAVFQS